jgi:dolichol-phosphate mannosyltransferase
MLDQVATTPGPELTVVIPTRDENDNIVALYQRICATLDGVNWEVIFVDDDSSDGTPETVRRVAMSDRRVRLLHRIDRRGLASACIEGMQASTAPLIAVMDADLQHDETLLPKMLAVLRNEPIDIVIGSRYVEHGGVGNWNRQRARISSIATGLGRRVLGVSVADPMSGFFMLRREAVQASMRRLSVIGFKILIDLLASAPRPLRIKELPFEFRTRHAGESKFDSLIAWEYAVLLADKLFGHVVPVRFVLFSIMGGAGILAHLAILWMALNILHFSFEASQAIATVFAMIGNFVLNNWLTYRDMRLTGWAFVRGMISFCLICSVGAVANIGIATVLFGEGHSSWWVAGISGAAMSLVWNYAVSSIFTWRSAPR